MQTVDAVVADTVGTAPVHHDALCAGLNGGDYRVIRACLGVSVIVDLRGIGSCADRRENGRNDGQDHKYQ